MREMTGVVSPSTLRELVDTGAVSGATIRLGEDGQGLVGIVFVGDNERVLGVARGNSPRYFTSIDGAVSALQDCGINVFKLDATGFLSRGKKASARLGYGRGQGQLTI
jgi:hypothetical protein